MTDRILTVWDEGYDCDAAPLTSTRKQRKVVKAATHEGLVRLVDAGPFEPGGVWADIAATHAPAYVAAVRTGTPRGLAESQGFHWSPTFAEAVARIWRGHQRAVGLALSDRAIVVHPVSGAHHARVASGSGFCTFNYLARRPTVRSTLILDLDAHYGDGTDLMTAGLPEFSHFDIHGSSRTETDLTPRGQWHGVRNATEYFAALTSLPTALDRAPDLIHWQAGMDPYELDDVGGITGMSARRLYKRDLFVAREIVRRRISTVVTLAGGYVKGVERLHLQTFRALRQALQEVTL